MAAVTDRNAPPVGVTTRDRRLGDVWRAYKTLDRRIWILAGARCVNTMGFSLVMPFMAMYLVEQRGGTGATYGGIYLIAGIAAALGQATAGEASDRLGRRRVMVTALVLRSLNMVALGVTVVGRAPIPVIGTLIVSNGLLRSWFEPAASAAVTDIVPAEQRIAAFGLQRIGVNFGWALGPAIGGALAGRSFGALFFVAAPATLVAALATWRVADHPRGPLRAEPFTPSAIGRTLREHPAFAVYLLLVFAGATMTVQIFATLSVYCKTVLHMAEGRIGLLYTVNGVLVVLLQVPAVAMIERRGPKLALLLGPSMYALAYVAIGLSRTFWPLAGAIALLTAGEVAFSPALSDMAAYLGDPKRLGRAFGLFGLMQQLGLSVGPLVGGAAYDHLRSRPLAMWGSIAAGTALVGVGYALFARRVRLA